MRKFLCRIGWHRYVNCHDITDGSSWRSCWSCQHDKIN